MSRAFISHSSPDDRFVQEMVQYVHALGYAEVFNDGHTIAPDELFWDRIEMGIRECDAFVVILSHASVLSKSTATGDARTSWTMPRPYSERAGLRTSALVVEDRLGHAAKQVVMVIFIALLEAPGWH